MDRDADGADGRLSDPLLVRQVAKIPLSALADSIERLSCSMDRRVRSP